MLRDTCGQCVHKSNRNNIPILVPSGVVEDVAVLGYGLVNGLACERQMNLAPDDLTPNPIESPSGGFPPLRNTKYTCK